METIENDTLEAETNTKFFQCEVCDKKLDNSIIFWCRRNKDRFKGKVLCKEHQKGH